MNDARETRLLIWWGRLFRWSLAVLFITVGVVYYHQGGWPAIGFGLLFLVTGFLRPVRCLNETCDLKIPGDETDIREKTGGV